MPTQTTQPLTLTGCTEVDHDIDPGTPEWQRYATGSKIAPILGTSPYTTRLGQWRAMRGDEPTTVVTDHMRWGTDREPVLRAAAAELYGPITETRMWVKDDQPRHGYSPDGVLADGRLWEAKTCTAKRYAEDWADGPPAYYLAQVQWGLYVMGLPACLVTVEWHEDFTPVGTADYEVTRDDAFIADTLATVADFLAHVDDGTPPPPLGSVVVTGADAVNVEAWADYNAARLEAEKWAKQYRPHVDRLGKNAAALIDADGQVLCHWSNRTSTTETVDWDAVIAAHPDEAALARVTTVDTTALAALLAPAELAAHTTTRTTTTRILKAGSPA